MEEYTLVEEEMKDKVLCVIKLQSGEGSQTARFCLQQMRSDGRVRWSEVVMMAAFVYQLKKKVYMHTHNNFESRDVEDNHDVILGEEVAAHIPFIGTNKIHGVILILKRIIESVPEVYSLSKLLLHLESDDSAQVAHVRRRRNKHICDNKLLRKIWNKNLANRFG
ncbi:hypothetical protein YC2023_051226 [Brassica napus]